MNRRISTSLCGRSERGGEGATLRQSIPPPAGAVPVRGATTEQWQRRVCHSSWEKGAQKRKGGKTRKQKEQHQEFRCKFRTWNSPPFMNYRNRLRVSPPPPPPSSTTCAANEYTRHSASCLNRVPCHRRCCCCSVSLISGEINLYSFFSFSIFSPR